MHRDRDVRRVAADRGDRVLALAGADRRRDADADGPGRDAARLAGRGEGGVGGRQGPARGLQQRRAGRRQPHLARGALDQLDAELVLEPRDGLRDGLLADAEARGGAGEAALLGDRDEGPQLAQLGHARTIARATPAGVD